MKTICWYYNDVIYIYEFWQMLIGFVYVTLKDGHPELMPWEFVKDYGQVSIQQWTMIVYRHQLYLGMGNDMVCYGLLSQTWRQHVVIFVIRFTGFFLFLCLGELTTPTDNIITSCFQQRHHGWCRCRWRDGHWWRHRWGRDVAFTSENLNQGHQGIIKDHSRTSITMHLIICLHISYICIYIYIIIIHIYIHTCGSRAMS